MGVPPGGVPAIPGHRYVIGADPAEGNPNSDESAACALDAVREGACTIRGSETAAQLASIEASTFPPLRKLF